MTDFYNINREASRFMELQRMAFPSMLRSIREEKQLTNAELAELAGVSENTIQRYQEPDRIIGNFEKVCRLAFALRIKPLLVDLFLRKAGFPEPRNEEEAYYRALLISDHPAKLEDVNSLLEADGRKPFKMTA